jgi:hypothetical protein
MDHVETLAVEADGEVIDALHARLGRPNGPLPLTSRPMADSGFSSTYSGPLSTANAHSSAYSASSAKLLGVHSSPCSSPAWASLRTVLTVTWKEARLPRKRPCDSARNPSRDTLRMSVMLGASER